MTFAQGSGEIREDQWIGTCLCGLGEGIKHLENFADVICTCPLKSGWSPRVALFGDMGNVNAQSLGRLQREAQAGMYDLILHVGDFAYDMDTVRDVKYF